MMYTNHIQSQPAPIQVQVQAPEPKPRVETWRAVEARRAPALAALRQQWNSQQGNSQQWNCKATGEQVSPASPPDWVQKRVAIGTKARGYAFEKKVGKLLTKWCEESGWKLWDHQWFTYTCGKDVKYFQPDFIIERPGEKGVVIEVKLTYVDTNLQLNKYLKYLNIFGLACFPVTIVRNLTPSVTEFIDDFSKIAPNSVLHLWL